MAGRRPFAPPKHTHSPFCVFKSSSHHITSMPGGNHSNDTSDAPPPPPVDWVRLHHLHSNYASSFPSDWAEKRLISGMRSVSLQYNLLTMTSSCNSYFQSRFSSLLHIKKKVEAALVYVNAHSNVL